MTHSDCSLSSTAEGAVHRATLADGHEAWLIVRYDESIAALNDPRLSKDMHAAFAEGSDVAAEGLPGRDFARHMLSVDPPDHTRLRRLVSAAFSPRRVESLGPRVQSITDDLLDEIAVMGETGRWTLSRPSPFPCPTRSSASFSASRPRTGPASGGVHAIARADVH